jgi:GNAT superfamily N-acetyltransferase
MSSVMTVVEAAQKKGWTFERATVGDHFDENPKALSHCGRWYPTLITPDGLVKVALSNIILYYHNGNVWLGDPSENIPNLVVLAIIAVDPSARQKGHATKAMRCLQEIAKELSMELMLESAPMTSFKVKGQRMITYKKLINWYKKLGFVAAYPADGEEILCYNKQTKGD